MYAVPDNIRHEVNFLRATELVVRLDDISHNARVLRNAVPRSVRMLGVVKADAYGHDAIRVSNCLLREGFSALAVAIPEEAFALRDAGIDCPILILGRADDDSIEECVARHVSMAIFDAEFLQKAECAAKRLGIPALGHLKCDTGMTRIGIRDADALARLLDAWRACPHVQMEGMFTHFCVAETDAQFTDLQNTRFASALDAVRRAGFRPIAHAAASSAMFRPACQYDQVRAGICLYGENVGTELPLRFAQTLRTKPVRIAQVHAGDTVGYGRTHTFDRDALVMTLPIGYGDGYPRILGNRARVLVHGQSAPIVGNVCMDMLMADVTGIPDVSMNDEVVLLGAQGNQRITPDELAALADTIPYEIMLGFLPRIRRTYQGG